MNWGADEGMLLRVHEMMVLSDLEVSSAAYGSARDGQLKQIEPVRQQTPACVEQRTYCVNRVSKAY
jgi:hypothetical protein